jgi:hypothetical protein
MVLQMEFACYFLPFVDFFLSLAVIWVTTVVQETVCLNGLDELEDKIFFTIVNPF